MMMMFCSTVAAAKYGMTSSLPELAHVWRNALPRGCSQVKSQLLRVKTVRSSIVLYMAAIMALGTVSFWHRGWVGFCNAYTLLKLSKVMAASFALDVVISLKTRSVGARVRKASVATLMADI